MESEGVSLPWIHKHPMISWNDLRKGDCCGLFKSLNDGYYCKMCDFFVHKKCGHEISESIDHPSHPDHTLRLHHQRGCTACDLCGKIIVNLFYSCQKCGFDVDLRSAKYPPAEVIDSWETHCHKLTLLKEKRPMIRLDCDANCGKASDGFPYKCDECDVTFHMDCVWHPTEAEELNYSPEVKHSYHSLHPLKLLTSPPPEYSDGRCRLCGRTVDKEFFYHCASCNFTLDMRCVLHPPQQSLVDLKTHDHQLNLLPRLDSFTCNICGLKGDRSPYVCFRCDFMIHQDCVGLPYVININRHDHRISRTSVLGVVNSVCGVCRQKVDWKWGGYSCHKCFGYVVHSKCATKKDVWNGKELEGVPEEEEDTKPYLVIDDTTIQHFSHKEHYLGLHINGILYEENKKCYACIHPVGLQSFYVCMDCDFTLHQNCAEFPRKRWHVLHNDRLTLVTSETDYFRCHACFRGSNGFRYKHEFKEFDVLCGSISEPFFHPSHPYHPLYYIPTEKGKICNGCNLVESSVLRCIEDACRFVLCFKCATLPLVVKHRVDDHPLSLCYGEEEAIGKYWCEICEKKINPKKWFYTCKDHLASLHNKCVHGEYSRLMPRSTIKLGDNSYEMENSYEVTLNNSMTRPFCRECGSHCIHSIILKLVGTSATCLCSNRCTWLSSRIQPKVRQSL